MDTTTMTETESVAVTEPMEGDFQVQYEAETRSGGLVLTDEIPYHDMFEEIENTESYNLLALAGTSSNLSTFVELLRTTGMMAALEAGDRSFTLFAPTNEAFAALPAGKLEYLLKPENRVELIDLLNAHILPSEVSSAQFNSSQRITLEDGRIVPITVNNQTITIGGATVVKDNIEASNGVIHVVDAIVTPTEVIGPYNK